MAVPDSHFMDMMVFYKNELEGAGIDYVIFGHLGDNHLHINLLPEESQRDMAQKVYDQMVDQILEWGGTVSAEHGIGKLKNKYFAKMVGSSGLKDLNKIIEGIEIVKKDLVSIFKKNGIEAIECINKKFDPNFHQAMLEIDDTSKEPGTVVQEIQKGYTMKGRLLRPSMVGVTRFKTEDVKKDQENKDNNDTKK